MIEQQYASLSKKEIKRKTKDAIRPDQVASFAFPDDVDITYMPNVGSNKTNNSYHTQPTFFWFVLTDVSGSRFYCATVCYLSHVLHDFTYTSYIITNHALFLFLNSLYNRSISMSE